jgi:hypothetical protein
MPHPEASPPHEAMPSALATPELDAGEPTASASTKVFNIVKAEPEFTALTNVIKHTLSSVKLPNFNHSQDVATTLLEALKRQHQYID